ncbi:hypothetical protein ABFS82_01G016300 [Erythranthe guttata]|uniref:Uncharacterized protein n=1 Tax=Erythranthe guttata TaxID=4155 RepID=A0A022Q1G8_ERYGU|nr:PREDICTED: transcription factor RAX1-like [Erythranthe guttata]EYU20390.1 hypothetical protein MIMGU_mgv1a012739mg [Erythranthe guttata]|eukprot:XP_012857956.1 PREDICTED: transcription factor RAX1-like [Erythranthe guttata]
MGRNPCCEKSKVKRGAWSPQEDATLIDYLHKHGTSGNWISLPLKAGLQRCGKSCRLRWLNYLRPDIKHGPFTQEEDNIICSLYTKIGSRWSAIASHLPGRTDNDVKNYWNTKLKKKLTTTTTGKAAATAAASRSTTNPPTNVSAPTSPVPLVLPSSNNSVLANTDDQSVHSYDEPVNFTLPGLILEGSSNYSSGNNSCPFMDESCGVLSWIWSQEEEAIGADNNADLFSIFSKPHGLSQTH